MTLPYSRTEPLIIFLRFLRIKGMNTFYKHGYTIINNVSDINEAKEITQKLISSIDTKKLPLWSRFLSNIKLLKCDEIPVCEDVVESSYQVLHLDMGQPIISREPQDMYLITGLYLDKIRKPVTARTRVMSLKGLFKNKKWGGKELIEKRIIRYAKKYGDGWFNPEKINTKRLACFARIVDAVADTEELKDDFNKTMGQWFRDEERLGVDESMKNEYKFYQKRGISLGKLEKHIQLKPGQLLIFDNTRVIHGRAGKRVEKEVWQMMFGVRKVSSHNITAFRKFLVNLLTEE